MLKCNDIPYCYIDGKPYAVDEKLIIDFALTKVLRKFLTKFNQSQISDI